MNFKINTIKDIKKAFFMFCGEDPEWNHLVNIRRAGDGESIPPRTIGRKMIRASYDASFELLIREDDNMYMCMFLHDMAGTSTGEVMVNDLDYESMVRLIKHSEFELRLIS